MSGLLQRVAGLSPAKRALLARRNPLSFEQERLWLIENLVGAGSAYNIFTAVELVGELNLAALESAVAALGRRHEVLRTAFLTAEGRPYQLADPAVVVRLPKVDLEDLETDRAEAEATRLAVAEEALPFDLERPPLLRVRALRESPRRHTLLVTVHHVAADGWSMGILVRDLAVLYEAFRAAPPGTDGTGVATAALPELPIQYADYAHWQRERLSGERLEAELGFWRGVLGDERRPLELPTDRPRPARHSFRGASVAFSVPAATADRLRRLARRRGATLFAALLGVFQVLLARYSGQRAFHVGMPTGGRARSELESLVGFFVNTLVVPARIDPGDSFEELLATLAPRLYEVLEHQELPFAKLVEQLAPERSLGVNPLTQVLFVLQNVPREESRLPGLSLSRRPVRRRTAVFDLTASFSETADGGLSGSLQYSTVLFDATTLQRMADHLGRLVAAVAARPGRPLGELEMLSAAQRQQVEREWNDTAAGYPRDAGLCELFAAVARRRPRAVALAWGSEDGDGGEMTYGDLASRVAALAARLAAAAPAGRLARGEPVLLAAERSPDLVVAILAVLAAGGCYVPLDAAYPPRRLAWMAEDSGARLVVADRRQGERLEEVLVPAGSDRRLLWLDGVGVGGDDAEELRPVPVHPLQPAYVMYTSGSTGRPKGVTVRHRNVVRLVHGSRFVGWGEERTFLLLAPASFDASTLELWGPLLHGGRLAVAPPGPLSLGELSRQLHHHRVTTLWLTAGLFHQMVDEALAGLAGVEELLAGGDVLSPGHVRRVLQAHPGCTVIDGYGPTENTTFTTTHPMSWSREVDTPIPVGRPIAHGTAHVLDAALGPVAPGVVGELFAGGDGLAQGYHRRPALTAERFVPDPFSADGGRLYRTGDRVRWLADGRIQFLGRDGGYLKLRGFRIEPGEVVAALIAHPSVGSAEVGVRGADADGRLVAWLVPAVAAEEPSAADLDAHLGERLPAYMVPAAYVVLDALPLTPNGKLDRGALPDPEWGGDDYAPPRTATEEALCALFADVLSAERLGVHDDFFALGGHSLLATRLLARAQEALGVELPVRDLFERPTPAELAPVVDALRAGGAEAAADAAPIPRRAGDGPWRLSFAQERLWFLDRLEPGGSAYNLPLGLRLAGDLDAGRLAAAFAAAVRRHEVLRTTFHAVSGAPVQRIGEPDAGLARADLSALPPARREAELHRLASREGERPFDLAAGPVVRCALVRLAADDHALFLTLHHVAGDGWSLEILGRDVDALYAAGGGRAAELPELPIRYADFAGWQRDHLEGRRLEEGLEWWRRRLAGAPPLLELPTDRPRGPQRGSRGAVTSWRLGAGQAAGLGELARRQGASRYMAMAALFAGLLGRYAGQREVSLGTPVSGRRRPEVQELVGFFVNTLVLRLDLAGEPTPRRLVERARQVVLAAQDHQDVPFERVVEAVDPVRSMSHAPLFQVMLAWHAATPPASSPGGLRARPLARSWTTSKFDLTLSLTEVGDSVAGHLDYSTELFDATTVERLGRHLSNLVDAAVAAPDRPLGELPVLSRDERQQLLVEWNDTRVAEAGEEPPVPLQVLAWAARRPGAVAVGLDGDEITYGELDAASRRLAIRLGRRGVGPEVPVAVAVERGPALVTALLAAWRAGGYFVVLDPGQPAERLGWMLADCGARVVVAGPEVEIPAGCERLDPPAGGEPGPGGAADGLDLPPAPQAAAYAIYTSGSTGRPKGVVVSHGALANRLRWARHHYPTDTTSVGLHKSSPGFDVGVWEMFGPLVAGGRVEAAPEEAVRDPAAMAALLHRRGVTLAHFVPTLLEGLVAEPGLARCTALRQLFSGGEALPPETVAAVYRALPGVTLRNQYGPTEITVDCTEHTCRREDAGRSTVPLGRPIDNYRVHVVDRRLRPLPLGVAGELVVAGRGVARGYLGRPARTAGSFVPDPFSRRPGGRLYRTGDLARRGADGRLEFLGRLDHQVKLRGVRIELGEIEAAAARLPVVRQAVVLLQSGGAGRDAGAEPRLVAWLVPAGDERPDGGELRAALAETLPEPMLPASYVWVDRLPSTATGKLDRDALPDPTAGEGRRVAPRTPVEARLCDLFAEVLGGEQPVGAEDGFFELGGHSLLATRLLARVQEELGVEVPVRRLFDRPTVAGLAEAVEEALRRQDRAEEIPRRPGSGAAGAGEWPLSFSQERLWFLDRLEPGATVYNMPTALRLAGRLDGGSLARAWSDVVARHEVLRTTYRRGDDGPLQVVHPPPGPPGTTLARVDLRGLLPARREAELRRRTAAAARRPFDLTTGPLVRALLVAAGEDDHALLVTLHHVASDGWSMEILVRDVTAHYRHHAGEGDATLPGLPVQYADFAVWQRRHLVGDRLEAGLEHWRRRLTGAPALLELPTDRPRPAARSWRGADLPYRLPPGLAADLRAYASRHGASPYMAMVALFAALLGRWTGGRDVPLGTPVAGRRRPEVQDLVGFFANTLVLRLRWSGRPALDELLERAREVVLDAQDHQDVPFEKVVEALDPERSLGHSPLFQVMLAWHTPGAVAAAPPALPPAAATEPGADTAQALGGAAETLSQRRLAPGWTGAKFDLTLSLRETAEAVGGRLEYSRELFDASTVRRLLGHLTALVTAALAEPGRPLDELPLMTPAESQQALVEWNDSRAPDSAPVLHQVLAQAARRPRSSAVNDPRESLTYGELEAGSRHLAARLRAAGAGPEVPVAVALPRGTTWVTALLAVWRAGAAFVPVDPDGPAERLALMLEDCAAPVVVAPAGWRSPPLSRPPQVVVPEDHVVHGSGGPGDADGLDRVADGSQLAYVLYTSGSTGVPKGVAVSHGALANRLAWSHLDLATTAADAGLQKAAPGFDIGLFEVFGPLVAGGRVEVAPPEVVRDPAALVDLMRRRRVTQAHLVPTLLGEVLAVDGLEACRDLRRLFSGGEVLPPEMVSRVHRRLDVELINQYGPTEAVIDCSARRCPPGDGERPALPIGRPLRNVRLFVVDRRLRAQPVGVVVELAVGAAAGEVVARGYLGRPARTAQAFVPDPFAGRPGGRLYLTGDLVRWSADGEVEFLGRRDQQVKLRGFRIELGEVESALVRLPGVSDAVVRLDGAGDTARLVAWYVADDAATAPAAGEELHAALAGRLPDFAVPAAFVAVERIPLTPAGKVDLEALPAPQAESRGAEPRTALEGVLCEIFAAVLGHEAVGTDADFFALGGHSLLAMRLVSRVRAVLGRELSLRQLFTTPTPGELAALLEAGAGADGEAPPPLVPVPRPAAGLPLSFSQQRLWFLDRLDPGRATYNLPLALRLDGDLRPGLLAAAFDLLRRRHEVLRTRYALRRGIPVQHVEPPYRDRLPVADLVALPAAPAAEEARRLAAREAGTPFDLAAGRPLRARLVALPPAGGAGTAGGRHLLLATLHHVAGDGWSNRLLVEEVGSLYAALAAGVPPAAALAALPPLPVQYADFAAWQRSWLEGDVLEREVGHWRRRLQDVPRVLDLPTDRPRRAVRGRRGATLGWRLERRLADGLRRLGRRHGATPFITLLAAWQVLMARYGGQRSFNLGSPTAGRTRLETERLVGFFVHTLVLPADLGGGPGFAAVVERARDTVLDAHAHQEVPFEKLVEELEPRRDLSRTPLFQVMVVFQSAAEAAPGRDVATRTGGLRATPFTVPSAGAKFDLSVAWAERDEGFGATVEYDADLFDRTTIRRMVGHFQRLVEAVLADPGADVWELSFLSPAERRQLLAEWSDTAVAEPARLVPAMVLDAARRRPAATAVAGPGGELTYGELDERSRHLAAAMAAAGAGTESVVAVFLERGPALVVALLAAWRAGAAFAPFAPSTPRDRMAWMLEDSAARVVVAAAGAEPPPTGAARLLPVDAGGRAAAAKATGADEPAAEGTLDAAPHPLQAAYLLYTSGSTGRPKGVVVGHAALANRLRFSMASYPTDEGSVCIHKAAQGFDVTVWEVFGALAAGARLVAAPEAATRDPARLTRLVHDHGVTQLHVVPTLLKELLARAGEGGTGPTLGDCSSLRHLFSGGEVLPTEAVAAVRRLLPAIRLHNQYGPTEATVDCSEHVCAPGDGRLATLPIGRPIRNLRLHVADPRLRPVPIGVAGELLIGGRGVARGYLGRPARTAGAFVPDPFSGEAGARLYRSGDLARWRADGELEFLGRVDHQVKLRGVRVELGEIEAALLRLPGVSDAAVRLHGEGADGGPRLVAWLVDAGDERPGDELRRALAATLPEPMLPQVFVRLDRVPRTASGKLDRAALPEPEPVTRYVPPSTPAEEALCALFSRLLEVPRVGAGDDFFALGGHSLLAVRLLDEVERRFAVEVPLAALFRHPTVAALARLVAAPVEAAAGHLDPDPHASDLAADGAPSPLVPIRPGEPDRPPLFLFHPVGGNVLCYAPLSRALPEEWPVVGVQAVAPADPEAPVASLPELVAGYLQAVRRRRPAGPYRLAGWSMGGVLAFEAARQLVAAGDEVAGVAVIDAPAPRRRRVDEASLTRLFLRDLAGLQGLDAEPLHDRWAAAEGSAGERLLAAVAGSPLEETLTPDRLVSLHDLFRRNLAAATGYSGGPYGGEMVLLRSAARRAEADRLLGWGEMASVVRLHRLPGDHYTCLQTPLVEAVAAQLMRVFTC